MQKLPFSRIAPRYDLANRVLSLGMDLFWRRKLLEGVKKFNSHPERFLDIACGSGDVLRLATEFFPRGVKFFGLDPCGEMLDIARKRVEGAFLLKGKAEDLPFRGDLFDAVTVAFGIRNFQNRRRGLSEIHRVLKRGGVLGILEFSPPWNGNFLLRLGWFYTKYVVPPLGGAITGDRAAYRYLAQSIERFPPLPLFLRELKGVGFIPLKVESFPPSPAVLYLVMKPA